eukprot:m.637345 g.637345  ORF g.637345 m.637345 type:complete len:50 (-) comp22600_c1_seq19:1303-1452(-)
MLIFQSLAHSSPFTTSLSQGTPQNTNEPSHCEQNDMASTQHTMETLLQK